MANNVTDRAATATAAAGTDVLFPVEVSLGEAGVEWRGRGSGQRRPDGDEGADPEVAAAAARLSRRHGYRFVKRAFDIVFSLLILICFCWLFAIIAIAVKVDDPKGPVLFRQKRVTKDGREFTMYKFRSMCADAEERLVELRALNEKTGPVFKMRDDPRVTRVGRLLRRVSLDELPQFANVLKGDVPLRILKMRQVFSVKMLDAFALPANEVRTISTVFSQVSSYVFVVLRTLNESFNNFSAVRDDRRLFFAKADFRAVA